MNICFEIGNLTDEPIKIEGVDLVKFSIAVRANFTKADGTRPVDFFNVAVWGKMGENCLKYLHKGNKVAIVGRWQNVTYEKNGEKKTSSEIVATDIEYLTPKPEKTTDPIFTEYDGDCPF